MLHVKPSPRDSADLVRLRQIAGQAGVSLTDKAEDGLVAYVEALLEWNGIHNLISRADATNVWTRHILHSLLPLLLFRVPEKLRFIDIGSGGGLPGIPIAVLRPDLQGVLVDSVRKKTEALSAIIEKVGITNVSVVTDRVEAPAFVKRFRFSFDLAFARAVAPLPVLVKWSLRLLRSPVKGDTNGDEDRMLTPPAVVSLKGGDLRSEIAETKRMFPYLSIAEYPVELEGITDGFFTDKKIIIVHY